MPTSLLLETGAAPAAAQRAARRCSDACGHSPRSSTPRAPPAIAARARPLDALAGSPVELRLASGDAVVQGTAAGIADDGCLLVRSGGGEVQGLRER